MNNDKQAGAMPRPVQPYTVRELLDLHDNYNGDWCAIARQVEKYYITELDTLRAALARAPLPAQADVLINFIRSVIEDGYLSDTNTARGRAILDASIAASLAGKDKQ